MLCRVQAFNLVTRQMQLSLLTRQSMIWTVFSHLLDLTKALNCVVFTLCTCSMLRVSKNKGAGRGCWGLLVPPMPAYLSVSSDWTARATDAVPGGWEGEAGGGEGTSTRDCGGLDQQLPQTPSLPGPLAGPGGDQQGGRAEPSGAALRPDRGAGGPAECLSKRGGQAPPAPAEDETGAQHPRRLQGLLQEPSGEARARRRGHSQQRQREGQAQNLESQESSRSSRGLAAPQPQSHKGRVGGHQCR